MEEINYEEKCKEMAHKFWNDIFNRKWRKCDDFEVDVICNRYEREDIETTFKICKFIAYSQCNKSSCFCLKYRHLPFINEAFEWLAIGWGDPKVTSSYGYCYFDFKNDLVYITTAEFEDRCIPITTAFKEIYS